MWYLQAGRRPILRIDREVDGENTATATFFLSLSLYLSLSLSEEMEETDIAGGFPLLLRHPGVLWTVPAAGALCPALASSLKTVA